MYDQTGRLFLCARCQAQVLVCSHCDRGQRYCANGCANVTRLSRQREAGKRYQQSRIGRRKHAPVAQAPRSHSKDSDVSRFPGHPCRCCTTSQRITPGNLARFTGPITMQSYRPGFHCTEHHRQHPGQHAGTAVALPLVPITLSSTGAPRLSSPQQVGA